MARLGRSSPIRTLVLRRAVQPTAGGVQLRGSNTATSTATTCPVQIPSATQVGDLLILIASISSATRAPSLPAGWTLGHDVTGINGFDQIWGWRIAQPGDASTNVTVTLNGSGSNFTTVVLALSGADQTNPFGLTRYGCVNISATPSPMVTPLVGAVPANSRELVVVSRDDSAAQVVFGTAPTGTTAIVSNLTLGFMSTSIALSDAEVSDGIGGRSWPVTTTTGSGNALTIALVSTPTSTTGGKPKVWNGSSWVLKPAKQWTGSAHVEKPMKRWTGSAWVPVHASGGSAYPTLVGYTSDIGSGTLNVPVPTSLATGDWLLLFLSAQSASITADFTIPSGWARTAWPFIATEGALRFNALYQHKVTTPGSEPSTYAWSNAVSSRQIGVCVAVRGAHSITPVASYNGPDTETNAALPIIPGATATGNALAIGYTHTVSASPNNGMPSYGAPWTQYAAVSNPADVTGVSSDAMWIGYQQVGVGAIAATVGSVASGTPAADASAIFLIV